MAKNELEIILVGKDEATRKLKSNLNGLMRTGKSAANAIDKNFIKNIATFYLVAKAVKEVAKALSNMTKDLIKTSARFEQFKVRLETLLGSVKAGNQVFEDMAELASRVPKTYDEIMSSAANLSAVVREGTTEIKQLMPIIVDISAATGMSVEEVTGQIIRMYSAGAASADMFRERGVLAALGFQSKVSYTSKETMDTMVKQWEDGTGKYVDASKKLAETWDGNVSMMSDAWMQFRIDVGKEMFKSAKFDLQAIISLINKAKEEGDKYNDVIESTSKFFKELYEGVKDFSVASVIGVGQAIDVYNDLAVWLQKIINFYLGATVASTQFLQAATEAATLGFADTSYLTDQIDAYNALLIASIQTEYDLREQAKEDYSTQITDKLDIFMTALEEERAALEENEATKTDIVRTAQEIRAEDEKKIIDDLKANNSMYADAIKKSQVDMWTVGTKAKDKFSAGVSGMFNSMMKGTFNAQEAFTELGITMVQSLIDYTVQWAVNATIAKAFEALAISSATVTGATIAAAYAPAAAMVSLATFGGNAVPAMAGITATTALSQALSVIPALAEGGIVTKPTLALIGEAGPEAVVPLNGSNGMKSVNINIEMNNTQVRSEDDIELLLEQLSDMINREAERL